MAKVVDEDGRHIFVCDSGEVHIISCSKTKAQAGPRVVPDQFEPIDPIDPIDGPVAAVKVTMSSPNLAEGATPVTDTTFWSSIVKESGTVGSVEMIIEGTDLPAKSIMQKFADLEGQVKFGIMGAGDAGRDDYGIR